MCSESVKTLGGNFTHLLGFQLSSLAFSLALHPPSSEGLEPPPLGFHALFGLEESFSSRLPSRSAGASRLERHDGLSCVALQTDGVQVESFANLYTYFTTHKQCPICYDYIITKV